MKAGPLSVLVVIVNFRTPRLVLDCLESLSGEVAAYERASVVVVDNASGDGSAPQIARGIAERRWSAWARLVEAPRNGGFAYGNNLAVAPSLRSAAPPDAIWLLNPDTRVRPGALGALCGFLRHNPDVGIAGSLLEEGDGTPWPYAFRFPCILSEIERGARSGPVSRLLRRWAVARRMDGQASDADWVSGASMMIRREVFQAVGPMDDGYFLYFEETDFCLRARRAGWRCAYVPQARVLHIAGQSTGVTGRQASAALPPYWYESRRRYFAKNHGRPYAILADLGWMAGHMLFSARQWAQRRRDPPSRETLGDFVRHSALWRGAAGSAGR